MLISTGQLRLIKGIPPGFFRRIDAQVQDRVSRTMEMVTNRITAGESYLDYCNGPRLAHDSKISASASTSTRDRPRPVWRPACCGYSVNCVVPSINPQIEGAWRTHASTKGGNRCKLLTIPNCVICPSDNRFRSITKDLGSLREMPSFALSRRQHGFEPRWGHKIKVSLTRSSPLGHSVFLPWASSGSVCSLLRARPDSTRPAPIWVAAPPNAGCSWRTRSRPTSNQSPVDPAERSRGRGGLKGSTAIPNRYAQLAKGAQSALGSRYGLRPGRATLRHTHSRNELPDCRSCAVRTEGGIVRKLARTMGRIDADLSHRMVEPGEPVR
jgi:hypothetical protein